MAVVQRYPYAIKVQNGTSEWWLFCAGGRYSEAVVNSGLTVYLNYMGPWKPVVILAVTSSLPLTFLLLT